MKEINDEIKLTINLMKTDIDDGAHGELQSHLSYLLEMKRNEVQKRLDGTDSSDTIPKPLTVDELKAGGWWCEDVSAECANVFISKGFRVFNSSNWGGVGTWNSCAMDDTGNVSRGTTDISSKKQIRRIGNGFYWCENS